MPDRGREKSGLWFQAPFSAKTSNSETDLKQVAKRESEQHINHRKFNYDGGMHIWGYTNQVRDLRNGGMNVLRGQSHSHRRFVANRQAALAKLTAHDKGKVLDVAMSQRDDTDRVKPYNDQMDESMAHLRAVSANHLRNYST